MNRRDFYNKGVNDASEVYEEKFTHLYDRYEKLDKDIEKLQNFIGKDTEESQGNAVFTPLSENIITGFTSGVLNKYNSFSNLSKQEIDKNIVDAIANFITVAVERDMNDKFHKSLNILEQNGIMTVEKFESHKRSVKKAKQIAGLGVYTTFSLAPLVYQGISSHIQKKDMMNFIVGSYGYINQGLTPMIIYDIKDILSQMEVSINDLKIKEIFSKYCSDFGIDSIPFISAKNKRRFGEGGLDILAKEIVSRCDLQSITIKERALDFINSFLHISYSDAENIISDAQISQSIISDINWFSTINYSCIFNDFIKNASNVQQFSDYNIENDPFAKLREKRKECMKQYLDDKFWNGSLFLTPGKRKDILEASTKLMQYSLNPDYDIKMDIKMIKRKKKVMDYYGL